MITLELESERARIVVVDQTQYLAAGQRIEQSMNRWMFIAR